MQDEQQVDAAKLAAGATIHTGGLGSRHLDEPTLQNLDIHPANLAHSLITPATTDLRAGGLDVVRA